MALRSYRELKVWQVGMRIAELCYRFTKPFPKDEAFGMMSQINRSSSRIPANIAEGYGRRSRSEYLHFLHIAFGGLMEVETHILLAVRVELGDARLAEEILDLCAEEGKMLNAQIRSPGDDRSSGVRQQYRS